MDKGRALKAVEDELHSEPSKENTGYSADDVGAGFAEQKN